MLITTTMHVEGHRITRYGPLVASEAVMGTNIFRDYFAKVRDVVGGRSGSFQGALIEAREAVMADLQKQTKKADCNAIIGVQMTYGEVSGKDVNMLIVTARGTSIHIEPL